MSLYLSHIRLARSPSVRALAGLFAPDDGPRRRSAQHNLLWSAFSDGPDRERDFLWREESDGSFLVLSAREPSQIDLFEPHRVKPFAPSLSAGDRLDFVLRANATRTKRGGARVDVVMDALHSLPGGERAAMRMELARREGRAWLERQGEVSGFRVLEASADDYSTETLPSPDRRKGRPRFGIIDFSGRLEVDDPEAFLGRVAGGFGRAKAFGCGLMLVRRAR
ncbi:MAG: type I-E CRISPR-associated protein Cas6/Cse3/CasE [Mesorhizobium sp.]